jgi:hypothetical protein
MSHNSGKLNFAKSLVIHQFFFSHLSHRLIAESSNLFIDDIEEAHHYLPIFEQLSIVIHSLADVCAVKFKCAIRQ